MIRAWAPPEAWQEDVIALPADEAHHLIRVRRARAGDPVEVLDGAGRRARGPLETDGRRSAAVRVAHTELAPPPRVDLGLVVALPKGEKSDAIVQKGVELGLSRLWWFAAERSVARIEPGRRAARLDRWRRTAIEALKQCGGARLPDLRVFETLDELVAARAADECWILGALTPDARPLRDVLADAGRTGATRVAALIGPEGDFTPGEMARLAAAGAIPASFGPNVLRVETAALFAAAAMSLFLAGDAKGPAAP